MDIKSLREEYAQIDVELDKLIVKANSDEGLNGEETEKKEKLFARAEQLKKTADDMTRKAAIAFARDEIKAEEPKAKAGDAQRGETRKFSVEETYAAIGRTIIDQRVPQEFTGLITTSGSSVMLPDNVLPPVAVLQNVNPYYAAGCFTFTTPTTSAVSFPQWDDSSNIGATVAEDNSSETTPTDNTPSDVSLTPTLRESKTQWVSNTLLLANPFDLGKMFVEQQQIRLARAKHSAFNTAIDALTTGMVTVAANSASAITYADLLTWEHSLPVAYRYNMAFVVSDTFYKLLRGLVDDQHRPIMDTDPVNSFQKSIHGIPVYVSEYKTTVGASAKVGALINTQGVYINDVVPQRLAIYRDVPSRPDQVGYNLFQNTGFGAQVSAVRLFRMGIS